MCAVQGRDTNDWFCNVVSMLGQRRLKHCVHMGFGVYGGLGMIKFLTTYRCSDSDFVAQRARKGYCEYS